MTREPPPIGADEATTLVGFLEHQRATLVEKCSGLTADQMRTPLPPSGLTLAGLVKHLARVEDIWFTQVLQGVGPSSPWDAVDRSADPDWEWRTALDDDPADLFALWRSFVARSRANLAATDGMDHRAAEVDPAHGEGRTLRWIVAHMIEEYARHNGHADLIREAIDGVTGE